MNTVRSSDGTPIAFDRSGDGPPVILVAGALSTRAAAAPLGALLSLQFAVLAYDRRGRGDSGDTAPYVVEREVEDLAALIEEAGGSAFVYGHSSGAALALAAAMRGLPIVRLALYEPPFIVDDCRPPLLDDFASRIDGLVSAGRRGDAVAYFMTVGVGTPPDVVARMRSSPWWPGFEALAHTLAHDNRIMNGHQAGRPLPTAWTAMTAPTLVMDGGNSPPWLRHAAEAVADLLPNAEHRTLAGQDHGAAPEAVAPLLESFFRGP